MIPWLLLGGGVLLAASMRRRAPRRKVLAQPEEGTLRPHIVVAKNCRSWAIPESWWTRVAGPKFDTLIQAGVLDVGTLALTLLDGEVGDCALPPSLAVQTDVPGIADYWNGAPQMLYLAQHVGEVVAAGVAQYQETGAVGLPFLDYLEETS